MHQFRIKSRSSGVCPGTNAWNILCCIPFLHAAIAPWPFISLRFSLLSIQYIVIELLSMQTTANRKKLIPIWLLFVEVGHPRPLYARCISANSNVYWNAEYNAMWCLWHFRYIQRCLNAWMQLLQEIQKYWEWVIISEEMTLQIARFFSTDEHRKHLFHCTVYSHNCTVSEEVRSDVVIHHFGMRLTWQAGRLQLFHCFVATETNVVKLAFQDLKMRENSLIHQHSTAHYVF